MRTSSARRLAATLVAASVVLAGCGGSGGTPQLEVVGEPQAAVPVAGSSQVAITIANRGDGDDTLVGATTPAALGTEIHRTTVTDGRAEMEILERLPVPAGGELVFRPGELHLMLVVPDETVRAGGTLELTLEFERSDDLTVDVAVTDLADLFEETADG